MIKRHQNTVKMLSLGLAAMFFFWVSDPAYGTLGMKPQIKEVKLSRGGWTEFQFTVTNHGNEASSLVMTANNMDVTPDGQPFNATPDFTRGCAEWITFNPAEFTLEAGQSQKVLTRMKSSKEATGSFFAIVRCLLAEEKSIPLETGDRSSTTLGISVGVGSLVFVSVSSSQNVATLKPDSVKLDPGMSTGTGPVSRESAKGWALDVSILNEGNVYTQAWGEASIYTQSGRLIEKADLVAGRGYVFPDRSRIFTAKGGRALTDGAYLVRVNVFSREGKSGRGSFPITIANGAAYMGTDSEELYALLKASSPGFSLSQRFLDFDVMPNSRRTKGVTVYNNRPDTLLLRPRIFNWLVDAEGKIALGNIADTVSSRSCAAWVRIAPDSIIVPPGRTANAKITMTAPLQVEGENYAAIRFDTEGLRQDLPTEFQMPSVLLVSASNRQTAKPSAVIRSVVQKKIDGDGISFQVKLENNGNMHCFADGEIEIYNANDEKIGEPVKFGSREEFIFPGVTRTYSVPVQKILEPAFYRAYVKITYHEKTRSLLQTVPFQVD